MILQLTYTVFVQLLMMTAQQQQQPTTTMNCDERASCSYSDARRRNCYCDDLCRIYADCCADYDVTMTPPASDVIIVTQSLSTVSCQRLPDVVTRGDVMTPDDVTAGRETELYVVGRCPASYNDSEIVRRCELHASDNPADRFYRVPVVLRPNPLRLTYRNVYCAACTAADTLYASPSFYVIQVIIYTARRTYT